jgi:hypothetical protein
MNKGWKRIRLIFVLFWILVGTWFVSPHYSKLFESRAFIYEPVSNSSNLLEMHSWDAETYLDDLREKYPAYWNCGDVYKIPCTTYQATASFLFASGYLILPIQSFPNEYWFRFYIRGSNGEMTYLTNQKNDIRKWNEKFKRQIESALKDNYLYALKYYFAYDLFLVMLLPILIFQAIFYLLKWIKAAFNNV